MEFKNDIYISYALGDNESTAANEGWVNNFRKFLELLLSQILGENPSFLNYSNQEKPSSSELAKVGVLIVVLSPEFVKSEACVEEVEDFYRNAQKSGNLIVNGHERIFKVVKYPVQNGEEPSRLTSLLEYDLYYTNIKTGELSEFHDFFNADAERKFWLKLVDLAYDIAAILKSFRKLDISDTNFEEYNPKNVYLAETGVDLLLHRDNIKRELTMHGFKVFPDHSLPSNLKEMELNIKRDLEKSRLSIHLIGDSYGEYAHGSEKSVLDIQNKLAGEHSLMTTVNDTSKKFNRLIWISPDAKLENDKQKIFVDNLRRELEDNEGAEILQSPIEDFKMVVLDELLDLNLEKLKKSKEFESNTSTKNLIYIIYDKVDDFEAKKISKFLKYADFEVVFPAFEGKLLELREIHLQNLRTCDVALIFIDKVNDLWVQMKFLDLLKAPGLGRTKENLHKALILGKNLKGKIDQYDRFDVQIFEQNDNLENSLQTFLKEIKK